MKTIVHILNTGSYSGAENVVITLIKQMKKRFPNQYHFIYMSLQGTIAERLANEKIEHYPVKALSLKSIRKMVAKYQPDIIHAHDYTASMLSAAAHGKAAVICHLHNNRFWIRKFGIQSISFLLTTHWYKKILLVSDSIENEYIFGNQIRKKTMILGNPIDIRQIQNKSKDYAVHNYDIAFMGRLSEAKDPQRFIVIINQLVKEGWKGKALMIGDGELKGVIQKEIINLKLQKHIYMKGFMENPYPLLKAAQLLCITSKWEGYGLMAAEALALGVPVVSTSAGGLKQIIDSTCGIFCKTDGEFLAGIQKILKNTKYRQKLSEGALKRAYELHNIENYLIQINEIYHTE